MTAENVSSPNFVLLVEDLDLVIRGIVRFIGESNVRVARTIAEAKPLAMLPECMGLIVDLGMPDGDGTQVIEHALERPHRIPAMILTGRADSAASNAACNVGRRRSKSISSVR